MTANKGESVDREQEIMARFRGMRQQEAATAPSVPTASDLASRAVASERSWIFAPAPQLAVAASVLVAVVFMFRPQTQPDAGLLYADIMAGASFTTDPLLSMSHGVAPETVPLPGVYHIDASSRTFAQ